MPRFFGECQLEHGLRLMVPAAFGQLASFGEPQVRLRNLCPSGWVRRERPRKLALCGIRAVVKPEGRQHHPKIGLTLEIDDAFHRLECREHYGVRGQHAIAGRHAQGVGHVAERVDGDCELSVFTDHVHRPVPRRVGQPTGSLQGEPGLRPAIGGARVEPRLLDRVHVRSGRVLHEQSSRLVFDVLAVGVGEEFLPNTALAGQRPEPELLARHLLVARPMAEAVIVVVVVAAEEVVQLAHDVIGLVSGKSVVVVDGQEAAGAVDGPRTLRSRMGEKSVPRYEHLEVVARERRRRHPVVIGLLERGGVVPQDVGLEVGAVGGQADLDAPVRAGRQVHRPDDTAHAAIGVLAQYVVDGCGGGRGVADHAEVEFDPARGPRPAQRDVAELHHLVAIDELMARALYDGPPHLAARLREHEDFDEIVLEVNHLPLTRHTVLGVSLEGMVRVQPGVARQDRDRIGLGERIGREDSRLFRDACGLRGGTRPRKPERGKQ